MSLIIFQLLIICLSLHACACSSARPLQIMSSIEGITGGVLQLSAAKGTKSVREVMGARIDEGTTLASFHGENKKNSEELGGRSENSKGLARRSTLVLSSAEVMHATIKIEDQRRQARTLESLPSNNNEEEIVGTKEKDNMGEDIVVMDYAQPRRKAPIHNKEP